jgi:septal ring factor EnvC (AmiA/AmiB activator)
VKIIQSQYETVDRRIEEIKKTHIDMLQKLAILEHQQHIEQILPKQIEECEEAVRELDKRMHTMEGAKGRSEDRWNKIATFIIQLVWVVMAAYMLTKLNLQSPSIP